MSLGALLALGGANGCGSVDGPTAPATDEGGGAPGAARGRDDGESPRAGEGELADEDPGAAAEPTSAPRLANGITVDRLAIFQGVRVGLVEDGAWVSARNAPVVAGRDAVVRVYVTPRDDDARTLTAELTLAPRAGGEDAPVVLRATRSVAGPSSDGARGSAFDFEVPARAITTDVTLSVRVTEEAPVGTPEPAEGAPHAARFPRDGARAELGAERAGKLRVVLVPIHYDADGSGRLPDVGPAQLRLYEDVLRARYPLSDLSVTTRAPARWPSAIQGSGAGFSTILRAVTQLRRTDGADDDVYYYGLFSPAASQAQFCRGGCVVGLSALVDDPRAAMLRASVGVGFAGQDSVDTAAHEIAHAHGRAHAPCGGAAGADPRFPYPGGGIGVWGYDVVSKRFVDPARGRDMMGYCPNEWVSDYTFAALFTRLAAVSPPAPLSGARVRAFDAADAADAEPRPLRRVTVDAAGGVEADDDAGLAPLPSGGAPRRLTFLDADGAAVATGVGRFFAYDHLPGGVLVVPTDARADVLGPPRAWSRVAVEGLTHALRR